MSAGEWIALIATSGFLLGLVVMSILCWPSADTYGSNASIEDAEERVRRAEAAFIAACVKDGGQR